MNFTNKNKANENKMILWLDETANILDDILNGDIEDIFAVSGKYSDEIDEIYNHFLNLHQMITILKSNALEDLKSQS